MAAGLTAALSRVGDDLRATGRPFTLVGGFAISARTVPRFTRDVDVAVAVDSDAEAEALIAALGYGIRATVEQPAVGRLATARLLVPSTEGVVVDILFASSGIEREITAAAEPLEIIADLWLPVATVAHLIAMKVLSEAEDRGQDRLDLQALLRTARRDDVEAAHRALALIHRRGYARQRDLSARLDGFVVASGGPDLA